MVLPLIPLVAGAVARVGGSAAVRGAATSSAAKFGGKAIAQGAIMRSMNHQDPVPQQQQSSSNPFTLDLGAAGNQAYTSLMQPGQFG